MCGRCNLKQPCPKVAFATVPHTYVHTLVRCRRKAVDISVKQTGEERIATLEERMATIDGRMQHLEEKVGSIDSRIERLEQTLERRLSALIARFDSGKV